LAAARRVLLGLDYDGTLAPFQVDRMAAVPLPGIVPALRAVTRDSSTHLVIISGRRVTEVAELLGPVGVMMVGSHGYERRHADGRLEQVALDAMQVAGLARALAQGEHMGHGRRLERKLASLAFHTRGMDPLHAQTLERQMFETWSALTEASRLACRHFDGGVELRAEGVDKGTVLDSLLHELPVDLAVYVGDDATDEDAFDVLRRQGGIGIKVGQGDTLAAGRLLDCTEVLQWLRRWTETRDRR